MIQQQHYYTQHIESIMPSNLVDSDNKNISIRNINCSNDLNNNEKYKLSDEGVKTETKQEPGLEDDSVASGKKQYQRIKKPKLSKQTNPNEHTDNSLSADENLPSPYSSNQSYQYSNQNFLPTKFYPQQHHQQQNGVSDQIYPWMKDSRQHNLNFSSSGEAVITQLTTESISPPRISAGNSLSIQMVKSELGNATSRSIGSSSSPATSNPSESLLATPNNNSSSSKASSKNLFSCYIYFCCFLIRSKSTSTGKLI
jgi:hypothetical protein